MRVMSKRVALAALRSAEAVETGNRQHLPQEIVAKKKEIATARRNAFLFIARTGMVDERMINRTILLMYELSILYKRAEGETTTT